MIRNYITQTLNKPYPFLFSLKKNLIIAIVLGLLIFIINLLAIDESYAQNSFVLSKLLICILAGLVTFFSVLFAVDIIPRIFFKPDLKENWTIGKECFIIIFLFIIIAISNNSMSLAIIKEQASFNILSHILNVSFYVFVIGSIPTMLIIWLNYTILLKENLKEISFYNKQLVSRVTQEKNTTYNRITIQTNNKKEVLQLDFNTFLFAKSEGNYTDIFTKGIGKYDCKPYRLTIQNLEEALAEYTFIIRPHRSYVINIKNISATSGNARNYRIHFDEVSEEVPVSRDKFKTFKEAFNIIKV